MLGVAAVAVAPALSARRQGYGLGDQLGFTVAATLVGGVAWAAGLALVVAAAVAGGMLERVQLVVAAVLGGVALDIWLYDLLDFGAGGALAVSLLLGPAVIGLTVLTRRRLTPAGSRPSS